MKLVTLVGSVVTMALLAGCGGGESPSGGAQSTAGGTGALSYYRDVKPILDAKCSGCHSEGGIAPFSLLSYEAAAPFGGLIKQSVANKTMPPWPPHADCAEYDGDRSLSDDQINTITAWVDGGLEEGDPADEGAPLGSEGEALGDISRVDKTLSMPIEYTPQNTPDDYRCFVIDWEESATTYVTGFRANPGEPKIVHHVIAFLAGPAQVAKAIELDDAEEGPGYTCYGGSGVPKAAWLGAWVPGSGGRDNPAGTGIKVEPGSKVILQVHYNTLTAGKLPDKTTIDLKLDSAVEREAIIQPWTNPSWPTSDAMKIPAFEEDVMHSFAQDPTLVAKGQPLTIFEASMHMHTLGRSGKLVLERASGEKSCLLDIRDWNFHWQGSYRLKTPVSVSPGDKLYVECHWDNSPPNQPVIDGKPQMPKDVFWGEGTTDEMCLGGVMISPQ
jgi:hypothetical protein